MRKIDDLPTWLHLVLAVLALSLGVVLALVYGP